MTSFRTRPRFQKVCKASPEEVQTEIKKGLKADDAPCVGTAVEDYIVLKSLPEDRHFWSPQLSLSFEEHEKGTLIRGLYGPNPTVWGLFTFGYATITILALFVGVMAISNYMLDKGAELLLWMPVFAGLAFGLYMIGQTGQKLGAEQTFILHHFFENTVHSHIHIE